MAVSSKSPLKCYKRIQLGTWVFNHSFCYSETINLLKRNSTQPGFQVYVNRKTLYHLLYLGWGRLYIICAASAPDAHQYYDSYASWWAESRSGQGRLYTKAQGKKLLHPLVYGSEQFFVNLSLFPLWITWEISAKLPLWPIQWTTTTL